MRKLDIETHERIKAMEYEHTERIKEIEALTQSCNKETLQYRMRVHEDNYDLKRIKLNQEFEFKIQSLNKKKKKMKEI
jgi:hypothetical protein